MPDPIPPFDPFSVPDFSRQVREQAEEMQRITESAAEQIRIDREAAREASAAAKRTADRLDDLFHAQKAEGARSEKVLTWTRIAAVASVVAAIVAVIALILAA